eukprot:678954-Pyramimonas_sp.AAC.1
MGSVTSQSVGAVDAECQNEAGECFHDFLQATDLWLPSTFLTAFSPSASTWTSPSPGSDGHRLDSIAVSESAWVTSQGVDDRIDLTVSHEDHRAVSAHVHFMGHDCMSWKSQPGTGYKVDHDPA